MTIRHINILLIILFSLKSWAQGDIKVEKVQKYIDNSIDNKYIFGATLSISKSGQIYNFSSGNINSSDQYFIASITKLYTTSIIFQLEDNGKINLNNLVSKYISSSVMDSIHIYEGIDYSDRITIYHLISNTSGLPDYFEQENTLGNSIKNHLLNHGDTLLTFNQIIEITKSLSPQFTPGKKGKAFYSDVNFQLLGQIIETVTGKTIQEAYDEYIFKKLNLQKTYLYSDTNDKTPAPIYYKNKALSIPKMMCSFKSDGGIVSTSEENMLFLTTFFEGSIFSKSHINIDSHWNKIYFPFKYGIGLMRFKYPGVPELIGHAGASGSFAYYVPSKDIYITGSVNQIDKPQRVYKLLAKILTSIK